MSARTSASQSGPLPTSPALRRNPNMPSGGRPFSSTFGGCPCQLLLLGKTFLLILLIHVIFSAYLKHLEWFQYLRSSDSYAEFDIKYHPSLNLSMCTGLRRDTGADVVVKVFDRDDGTAIGPGDRDVLARCCPGLRGCHVPSQPNSHFPQRGHKPGRCWDGGGAWGRHALPLILRRLSSACCAAVAVRSGAGGAVRRAMSAYTLSACSRTRLCQTSRLWIMQGCSSQPAKNMSTNRSRQKIVRAWAEQDCSWCLQQVPDGGKQ